MFANPIDGLQLNLNFGYNQFRSKPTNRLAIGYVDPSVKLQPEINVSGGVQYAFRLGAGGSLTPRLDWTYQSFMTNGAITIKQLHPDNIIPGYSLFNFRGTYEPNEATWSVSAGVTNLFNKFYWEQLGSATTAARLPTIARVGTPGLPREWSVTFRKSF